MISSLSISEIKQKLVEMRQENLKLKEILKQNTLFMKQQFDVLLKWQEEMMKIHEQQKYKFENTKDLIKDLKKQNTDMKMRLQCLEHGRNRLDEV